jgi:hypothetical protein
MESGLTLKCIGEIGRIPIKDVSFPKSTKERR